MHWVLKNLCRWLQPSKAACLEARPSLFSSAVLGASCATANANGPSLVQMIRAAHDLRFCPNSSQVMSCDGCRKIFADDFNHQMLLVLKRDLAYSQAPLQVRFALPSTRMNLRWFKLLGLRTFWKFAKIRPQVTKSHDEIVKTSKAGHIFAQSVFSIKFWFDELMGFWGFGVYMRGESK